MNLIADAVVTADKSGLVRTLNPAAEAVIGWTQAEAIGKPVEEIVVLRERQRQCQLPNPFCDAIQKGVSTDRSAQYMLIDREGRRIAIEFSTAPLKGHNGYYGGCVFVFRDVSHARQLAERMSYLAHHDTLTGLPNRILLVDRLEQGIKFADRHKDQLAVLFLDLDHFTEIKATIGSTQGDELLKEVAYRITTALRESDTVSRLGGDEFVIMLPGVAALDHVESVANKLLESIARPFSLAAGTVHTSCSIGISLYPDHSVDTGMLMRLADEAMYQAKLNGRNKFAFARTARPKLQNVD